LKPRAQRLARPAPEQAIEFHPAANIFPLLQGPEFDAMVADIKAHGLRESITLHPNGTVLDGRNRYRACLEAGVKPAFHTWDAKSADYLAALDFVLSRNLHRRHLDESQRAMACSRTDKELRNKLGIPRERGRPNTELKGKIFAIKQATQGFNVSTVSKRSADKVLGSGADELIEAVDQGKCAVSDAARIVDKPKPLQVAALELVESGKAKHLNEAVRKVERAQKANQGRDAPARTDRYRLICADLSDAEVELESLDWIITDPPYDAEAVELYRKLGAFAARALKADGGLIVMTGQAYLADFVSAISSGGGGALHYRWACAYLTLGASRAVHRRSVNCGWKPLLWFVKGAYQGPIVFDVFRSERAEKADHDWQQSVSGMRQIISRFIQPGEVVGDPFLGSGTTGVAALEVPGVSFVGIDLDPQAIDLARARLAEASAVLKTSRKQLDTCAPALPPAPERQDAIANHQ
jgi:ParB-like chromosome segregation protein Spo0J